MKIFYKYFLLIACIGLVVNLSTYSKQNRTASPLQKMLKPDQKVLSLEKNNPINITLSNTSKSDADNVNNLSNRLEESYYNNKVYIKFKSHNLMLNELNPENGKLFATNFSDKGIDVIGEKYGMEKIEQAFKINPKKYEEYLVKKKLDKKKPVDLQNIFIVYFTQSIDTDELIKELRKYPNIEYVEKVPKVQYYSTPNDTHYSNQFYFNQIEANSGWDIHKGESGSTPVLIGICDSGVEWMHSDLLQNLFQNLGEDADGDGHTIEFSSGQWILDPGDLNNIDDDFNGYTDDLIGWNFYTYDGSAANNPKATTSNKHGTHVAGIAAGVTNNSNGVASISWNIKFIPTRHSANDGSSGIYNAYDGIIYHAEFGADIINCSWGGGGYALSEQDVIDYANTLGSILIVSAGNANNDQLQYPASYHGVVSVASVASNDKKAYYSTFGNTVDISTPGGDANVDGGIYSSISGNTYDYLQGTSMASPLAAGLTALIKSFKPHFSNDKIIELLLANSDNIEASNELIYKNKLGAGRINALKSLRDSNSTLPTGPKLALINQEILDNDGNGIYEPGDTLKIVYKFGNYNHVGTSSELNYVLSTTNSNISIIQGSGNNTVLKESDFILDTLIIKIADTAQKSKAKFLLSFSCDQDFFGDSIFTSNILIIEKDSLPKCYGYIVYEPINTFVGTMNFNLSSPTTLNRMGFSQTYYARAGAWVDGKWYAVRQDNYLIRFDTLTGSRTVIGYMGYAIQGLAYDPTTKLVWGVGKSDASWTDDLFTINISTGAATPVFDKSTGYFLINLACNKYGELFAIDINNDVLIHIDKYDGTYYKLMKINDDIRYAQDMEYDYKNDMMIATLFNSSLYSKVAYIDYMDSTIIKLGDIQNNAEIAGFVIPNNYKPDGIVNVSPLFGQLVTSELTLKWNAYPGATQYDVNIEGYGHTLTTDTSISVPLHLLSFGKHTWSVEDQNGNSSQVWQFNFQNQYCLPGHTTCSEYISKFEFSDISNNSDCGLINGYSDYKSQVINVHRDSVYTVIVSNPSSRNDEYCGLWIDFNNNSLFDSNEFYQMLSSDGGSTFQTTLTIPSSATLGIHRIRVRLNYNQALNPCTPYNFGETEDYSINIKMPITYPSVLTLQISNIKSTTATSGGNIIFDGYSDIIARGVCWNTTGNPTILDSKTSETPNVGIYDSYITGLEQNQTFYVRAYATNKLGTAYGSELEGKTTNDETFRIPLNSGWNLISSKLIPKEPDSINHITNLIHNNLIIAKNSQGNVYIPQFSINTIGKWNITQGYLFFLNATDTLDIEGTIPVPSENPIGLVAGWNIVSYLRNSPMNSVTALASISDNGNLIIAKNLSGQVYIPAFGINTIGNLIPGQGYYIFVNNADTLIYPNN